MVFSLTGVLVEKPLSPSGKQLDLLNDFILIPFF